MDGAPVARLIARGATEHLVQARVGLRSLSLADAFDAVCGATTKKYLVENAGAAALAERLDHALIVAVALPRLRKAVVRRRW